MGGKRLQQISRRAMVQLASAGTVIATMTVAGFGLIVEACSSSDAGGYGYGYGKYGYGKYGYGYGYGILHRSRHVFARFQARTGPGSKVDLG